MRILVVEDEENLREILVTRLLRQDYGVETCGDGRSALTRLENGSEYDCVILDIMLPQMDGLSVLREMRTAHIATPVMLLTARDSVEDRVNGLDAGADDYVVKPFSLEEFDARVRALLRRAADDKSTVLVMADLELDTVRRTVQRAGKTIDLTSKEYALLEYFLRNPGHVLTREQILNHVWSYDFEGDSNIVDVYVRYLRRKMDRGFDPPLLHTVRGTGYVLKTVP